MVSGKLGALTAALLLGGGVARADVSISSKSTSNMSCERGVCTATAAKAVLNVGDLQAMLASGDIGGGESEMIRGMIVALSVAASATASAPVRVETVVGCSNAMFAEATSESPNADLATAAAAEMHRDCPVGYDVVDRQLSDGGRHLSVGFVCRVSVAEAEPLKTCGKQDSNPPPSN